MASSTRTLTPAQARRIAVAASGLDGEFVSDRPNLGHLRRVANRLGVIQIDSVNVLARAHRMPFFARIGPYPDQLLERAAWPARSRDRVLTETWAHEASLIPVELYPALRWERKHWSARFAGQIARDKPELLDAVVEIVREHGPIGAGAVEKILQTGVKGRPGWWEWSEAKRACEGLFAGGVLGCSSRRGFERQYDLIERVLPTAVQAMPALQVGEGLRQLVEIAARAYGVATVADLADYWRMSTAQARAAVSELVDAGALEPVTVPGWTAPAFLHTQARLPRRVDAAALLCPFDPLVWSRPRVERLFGFHYRIEIYTPEPQRVYGYYVCPFLLGDELVGRFDLKADRQAGALLVQASWIEPGQDPVTTAPAAAGELRRMADWLGLAEVVVRDRGNLAAALSQV